MDIFSDYRNQKAFPGSVSVFSPSQKKKSFRFLILMIFGGSWENMMKRVKTTCLKMQYKDASSGSCETVKSPAFTLGQ